MHLRRVFGQDQQDREISHAHLHMQSIQSQLHFSPSNVDLVVRKKEASNALQKLSLELESACGKKQS